MKQKICSNHEIKIVGKIGEAGKWCTHFETIKTPSTVFFTISCLPVSFDEIKKITWEVADKIKTQTSRKMSLEHNFLRIPVKASRTTLNNIHASAHTQTDVFILPPFDCGNLEKKQKEHYVDPKIFKKQIVAYYKDDVFSDEIASSIQKIATRLAFAPNFINYCVDSTTEALTKRGWLKYNEITKDDIILSYNDKTKYLTWSKIKDLYINKYKGKMHYLTTKGLDALVTPNHKFVSVEDGIKPVEHIKCQEHIQLMGLPVQDGTYKWSNEFIELVGWTVTEGNYLPGKYTHAIQVFQKKGPKADRIRNCLLKLNAHFKEYKWSNPNILGFRYSKTLANDIMKIAPNKVLSMDFIVSLPQEQRLLLVQTMLDGDGWSTKRGDAIIKRGYTQKDKLHTDNFIALCTLAGLTTSCTLINNTSNFGRGSTYYNINIYNKPKYTCKGDCINMHGGRPKPGGPNLYKTERPNIPTQDYNGIIWCPQTEYGTFVCRRGKYVYISGNTYREEMVGDALIKMIEALTAHKFHPRKGNPFSYFTKIAFHAFCNRIKREKRIHEAITQFQTETFERLVEDGVIPYQAKHTCEAGEGEGNIEVE